MPWHPVPAPFPASSRCPPLAGWPEKVSVRTGGPWHRAVPASPARSRRDPTGAQASRRGDAGSPGPLTHALCLGQPGHMCSHHHSAGKGGAPAPVPWGASQLSVFVGGAPESILKTPLIGQALLEDLVGGLKIAVGPAQGWHAAHMRDRACPGGRACLRWPGLWSLADSCLLERGSQGGCPTRHPPCRGHPMPVASGDQMFSAGPS